MKKQGIGSLLALTLALCVAPSVTATTLRRASVEDLVRDNSTIVVGEVIDAQSRWNDDHTFILTDVTVAVDEALQGKAGRGELMTVTLLGGSVGDLTTLIVGGAELVPGNSYVLFLDEESFPGREQVLTVRDHCQGAYDLVVDKAGGLRAVSQANGEPLVPDARGYVDAPGGIEGFPLDAMIETIRELADSKNVEREIRK